jgi:hypothetical protein
MLLTNKCPFRAWLQHKRRPPLNNDEFMYGIPASHAKQKT